jgi:hypothetical protein
MLPVEVEDVPVSNAKSPLIPDVELVAPPVEIETAPLAPRSDQPEETKIAPPVGPVVAVAFPPYILTRPPVLVEGVALVAVPPTIFTAPPAAPDPLEIETWPPVERVESPAFNVKFPPELLVA